MEIVPMSAQTLPQAKALVHRVFAHEAAGWLFFWAWPHRHRAAARRLLALVGVASLGEFWLAIDDHGRVVGTVGLHRFRKDAREAVWLSWYCRGLRVARTYDLVFRRVYRRQLELAQADGRDGGPPRAHNGIQTDDPSGRRCWRSRQAGARAHRRLHLLRQ